MMGRLLFSLDDAMSTHGFSVRGFMAFMMGGKLAGYIMSKSKGISDEDWPCTSDFIGKLWSSQEVMLDFGHSPWNRGRNDELHRYCNKQICDSHGTCKTMGPQGRPVGMSGTSC